MNEMSQRMKQGWSRLGRRHFRFQVAGLRFPLCVLFAAVFLSIHNPQSAIGNPLYPSWWTNRNVITNIVSTNDYVAVNQGQLKWFATNAYNELNDYLPNGVGTGLTSLVGGFTPTNNYYAVAQGQLKYVGKMFYDRLAEESYTNGNAYPWTLVTADDRDYAPATLGQMKQVFNFDLRWQDSDGDGIPDGWEMQIVRANTNDNISRPSHILPGDDFDGDGVSNSNEYWLGSSPTNAASAPSRVGFAAPNQTVSESSTNYVVAVNVSLLPAATNAVTCRVYVAGGTVNYTNDYIFTNQVLSYAVGETNKQVAVTIVPDPVQTNQNLEAQENLVLGVNQVTGAAVAGTNNTHVLYIGDQWADTDSDGLPNWWEQKYFGGATNGVAGADGDSDGWVNLTEYTRGSNPTLANTADTAGTLLLNTLTPLRK